jgi:transcriptional regulator with XRE-family HTH domain
MKNVEKIVGRRLRRRREALRISQTELGNLVGITFSQIQNYENANNKIGAGRLYELAELLRIPIEVLFWDAESSAAPNEELEMMRNAFFTIEEPRVKKQVLRLIVSIAKGHAPGNGREA